MKLKNSYVFDKIINKNNRNLIPYTINYKGNEVGDFKYFPSISKEWKNTSYFFNTNKIKHFSVNNTLINDLINNYFNSYFNLKFLGKNFYQKKKSFLRRIYVSKAELKHTNSKIIITIYMYNKQKRSLLKILSKLKNRFFKIFFLFLYRNKKYLENSYNLNNKFSCTLKQLIYKRSLFKLLLIFRRYKLKYALNKYKIEQKLLYVLANLIGKIYNKNIDFNIINLKSLVFNSDIFTKLLTLKLRNKKIHVIRNMDFILNKAKLPKINRIKEKSFILKNINWNLLENKYKNLNLSSMITNNLDKWLNDYYTTYNNNNYTDLYNNVFNSIKYKNLNGIRLEVKGRLTKRYRADRAIFKIRWKGGLKNIDSSFKGLSSVNLRGFNKPNIEYSVFTSTRRIGAFAVKGWVSGK